MAIMNRYDKMFAQRMMAREGAFVPFVVLGDPQPEASLEIVEALVAGGADALELGIPFSDPIADGPVIQAAAGRRAAGVTRNLFQLAKRIRERHLDIPIGLLVCNNLIVHDRPNIFKQAAQASTRF
jgi:tryptophan synthase alpha chain